MHFFYQCRKCSEEVYVEVVRGANDLPPECPHCKVPFDDTDEEAVLKKADEISREPMFEGDEY